MTWTSGKFRLQASFKDFAALLGYTFNGLDEPAGLRLHNDDDRYDKNDMVECYETNGTIGGTHGLKPVYDIIVRMFRHPIAPSGGNNDAIRRGLVHLMALASQAYLSDSVPEPNSFSFYVMDFIFREMHYAIFHRKVPPMHPTSCCSSRTGFISLLRRR